MISHDRDFLVEQSFVFPPDSPDHWTNKVIYKYLTKKISVRNKNIFLVAFEF
jgi:hypothetical protein